MKSPLLATLVLCFAWHASASAVTDVWQNSSLGDWFVPSNWSFGIGVPSATTDVEIGIGGTALINAPNAVAQAFLIGVPTSVGATGSVILGASGGSRGSLTVSSEIDIGASSVAGKVGNGTVTVSAGAGVQQQSGNLYIGFGNQGSTGRLTITDPGSIMSTAAPTFIGGGNSHGNFTVQNGGGVSTGPAELANDASSSGAATVTGSNSSWYVVGGFSVGYAGSGTLSIANGGTLVTATSAVYTDASVAAFAGSTGSVTVTGTGSNWSMGNLFLGGRDGNSGVGIQGGSGSLNITSGGIVQANNVKFFGGALQVDNGSLTTPGLFVVGGKTPPSYGGPVGDMVVGNTTTGRMEIQSGGVVLCNKGYVGIVSGSAGYAYVTGSGSEWRLSGSLFVASQGDGTVELRDTANIVTDGNIYIGFSANTVGNVIVGGVDLSPRLTAVGSLYVGGNAAGAGGSGVLRLENLGLVSATATTVYSTGGLALGSSNVGLYSPLTFLGGFLQFVLADNTTFGNNITLGSGGVRVFTTGHPSTLAGVLSGTGGLTKGGSGANGPGTLTLSAASNYTGATAVTAGTLLVNGSITSAANVSSGATIGGAGTIAGAVTVNPNAFLLGGNGTSADGALTVSNSVTLSTGANLRLVLGSNGTHSSLARTGGTWTFPSNLSVGFIDAGAQPGFYDNIITGLTSDPGTEGSWTITTPGFAGTFSYDGAGHIDLNLTAAPAPPPPHCTWSIATAYPIPVLDNGATSIGARLYSFGGVTNNAVTAKSYKFDGMTWTAIAPLPEGLESPAVVSDGTSAYIIGGYSASGSTVRNTLYRYNPASDTYTTLASSVVATYASAAVFLNGKLYRIGGLINTIDFTATNTVEVYDIASNLWTAAANYPLSVSWPAGFTQNGFVYAAGGLDSATVSSAKTYRYDPGANVWADGAIADLPAPRWGCAYVQYNGAPVLAGGSVSDAFSTSAISWDATTDTWISSPDMLQPRARTTGAVLAGSVYVIGGRPPGGAFLGTNDNQRLICPPPIQLVSAVSRKVHGSAGSFDIALPGVESRTGGASNAHTLLFTFSNPLSSVSGAAVTGGIGNVSSSAIGSDAHQYIVNLTGVTDAQTIVVSLTNVNDSLGAHSDILSASMGVLLGDSTGDRFVNGGDTTQTRTRSGQITDGTNLRSDVNADGIVNAGDTLIIRSRSGSALP